MQPKIVFIGHSNFSNMARQVINDIDIPYWVEYEVEEFPYQFTISPESIHSLQTLFEPATIVISGERSALLLNKSISNFVIPVRLSGFDIFDQIKQFNSKEVVVVNYRENIQALNKISVISNTNIRQISYDNRQEALEIMKQLKKQGIKDVIGGSWFCEAAAKMGLNAVCYYTYQSMKDAAFNALNILKSYRNEMEKSVLFKTIVDMNRIGIITTDAHARINVINHSAEQLLGTKGNQAVGKQLDSIIPTLLKEPTTTLDEPKFNILFEHNSKKCIADIVPVILHGETMGHMIALNDVIHLQQTEQKIRKKISRKPLTANYTFNDIIGTSDALKQTILQAKKFSASNSSVLIQGESGTGKELFAQSIHSASNRSLNAFVAVNCAAIPENLLDSELFGYEEGSFTGAKKGGKAGLFELAHSGTIFLDEISELPLHLQSRLLRVLQEKEIMRIGGDQVIPIDVRIIAASNKDLLDSVKNGTFREDLYYRINVLQLFIPPLRKRKKDLIQLFRHFISKEKQLNDILLDDDLKLLHSKNWTGNIRELENVADRFIVLCQGEKLNSAMIRNLLHQALSPDNLMCFDNENYENTLEAEQAQTFSEKQYIEKALLKSYGCKQTAADLLGMSRTTLWRKIKKYSINNFPHTIN